MHPLLFVALVCKQHVITFNHSILSEINYPHIHLLNCHHSTTIEDLFLFFASPNSSSSSLTHQHNNLIKTPESNLKSPTSPRLSLNYDQINTIMNTIQNNTNLFNSNGINSNGSSSNNTNNGPLNSGNIKDGDDLSMESKNLLKQHKRSSSLAIDNNSTIGSSVGSSVGSGSILMNKDIINSLPQSSSIVSTMSGNNETILNQNSGVIEKRNSVKGSHNKNIFSFDDRYYVFNEINTNTTNINSTNTNNINPNANNNLNNNSSTTNNPTTNVNNHSNHLHYHNNVHSMNDGNLTPSTPFNQQTLHVPFSLQKRTSVLSKRHFKHVNSPTVTSHNVEPTVNNIFDLQIKTNERKFRILILNNFRSVSKRVKFTLLEIFKYKKLILGDKIIDIPYEFICICDTLELPSPLLNEFIGFVPTLCTNTTATPQDIQNYSTNIQHIIQQQLSRMNEQPTLIDCVDMTVKLQQYIREIIIQCRNHHFIRKYPTSEALPYTFMACKAYALIYNKTFVTPTHVQSIISNLLYHRIECMSEDKWNVIQEVVSNVLPP